VLKANAPAKLFLQQADEELPILADLFQLSSAERALLAKVRKHAQWSSAYVQLAGGGLIRLIPDAWTRWLVSQDDHDRALREQAVREAGGDLRQAVTTLAQRSPYGRAGGLHA
jgi:hypothetical protein